jgi:hypothetical protein
MSILRTNRGDTLYKPVAEIVSMENMQRGYIALITILIISAVVLGVASTASLLAIGGAQSSFAGIKGENALQLVEGCAEDALLKSQQNSSYNGGTIGRPEGTCVVSVAKNGNKWTLTVTSTATDYNRTIQVKFTRGTGLSLTSWQEIPTLKTGYLFRKQITINHTKVSGGSDLSSFPVLI